MLLEILIGLAVLIMVFLGVASVFSSSHSFLKHSSNIAKASVLAETLLEKERRLPFDEVVNSSGQFTSSEVFNGALSSTIFNYSITVTNKNRYIKEVKVTITWTGTVGVRYFSSTTLIYGNT
ncbi:MAG: hypothetical protein M1269_02305 [Chloroflexi bacterium]|nr:hypothetical protein [Chloroflexota bacterium]